MPKKHKQGHNMPLNCQIAVLRRILRIANPWLKDVDLVPWTSVGGTVEPEHEWIDDVNPNSSLSANIDYLKQEYPLVKWEVPKKAKNKPLRNKERIEEDEEGALIKEERLVERHKVTSKGRSYYPARMQIGLNKWLKGKYAIVQIYVLNNHVDTEGMPYARATHYLYQHDRQWVKLLENRHVRPKKRKDVIPDEEGVLIRTEIIIKRYNQISLNKNLTSQYALVLVSIPKSHVQVEGMPHATLNKYLEQALKLAELEKSKKRLPRAKESETMKESKHDFFQI